MRKKNQRMEKIEFVEIFFQELKTVLKHVLLALHAFLIVENGLLLRRKKPI